MQEELRHIEEALRLAGGILLRWVDQHTVDHKLDGQPVTEADLEADRALREFLPRTGEGWLSEETPDDHKRLDCERVWIVDPLDGTKEFVKGIPEWAVSIALVERGEPIAGGIYNPHHDELILGGRGLGVTLNGVPSPMSTRRRLEGSRVVASRSEVRRGEWARFERLGLEVVPTGSVAYKLGLVACGKADLTWTLTPKNEWDLAAGVALVEAGGGSAWLPGGERPRFNNPRTRMRGLIVSPPSLESAVRDLLSA